MDSIEMTMGSEVASSKRQGISMVGHGLEVPLLHGAGYMSSQSMSTSFHSTNSNWFAGPLPAHNETEVAAAEAIISRWGAVAEPRTPTSGAEMLGYGRVPDADTASPSMDFTLSPTSATRQAAVHSLAQAQAWADGAPPSSDGLIFGLPDLAPLAQGPRMPQLGDDVDMGEAGHYVRQADLNGRRLGYLRRVCELELLDPLLSDDGTSRFSTLLDVCNLSYKESMAQPRRLGNGMPPPRRAPAPAFRKELASQTAKKQWRFGPSGPLVPELKRQSTPLHELCITEADGTLTCRKCGKPGFTRPLGLRSHLSHCEKVKEEKRQRLLAFQQALEAAEEASASPPQQQQAWNPRAYEQSSGPSSPLGMQDSKLPAQASSLSPERDWDAYGVQQDGETPLVPMTYPYGHTLVGREVSYFAPEAGGWVPAVLRSYRERTNVHMLELPGRKVVWNTLTTENCRVEGHMGEEQQAMGAGRQQAAVDFDNMESEEDASYGDQQRTYRYEATQGGARWGEQESLNSRKGQRKARLTNAWAPYTQSSYSKARGEAEHQEGPGYSRYEYSHRPSAQPHMTHTARPQTFATPSQRGAPGMSGAVSETAPGSSCRLCHRVFANKQALGWHTKKKDCLGAVQPLPRPQMPTRLYDDHEASASAGLSNAEYATASMEMDEAPVLGKRSMEGRQEDDSEDDMRQNRRPRRS